MHSYKDGVVFFAFADGKLKEFASAECENIGLNQTYIELIGLHVSAGFRKCGIDKVLFNQIAVWARALRTEKHLYLRI